MSSTRDGFRRSFKVDQVFGGLLILEEVDHITKYGNRKPGWKCRCLNCNNIIIATTSRLKLKKYGCQSCSIMHSRGINPYIDKFQTARSRIYNSYKQSAKKRKRAFYLDFRLFNKIIEESCYYCGREPQEGSQSCTGNIAIFKYNGVDRIDNSIGYVNNNCVACCKTCNQAKNVLTAEEFYEWINQCFNNLKSRKLIN